MKTLITGVAGQDGSYLTEGLHKTYDWALKNNFNYFKS